MKLTKQDWSYHVYIDGKLTEKKNVPPLPIEYWNKGYNYSHCFNLQHQPITVYVFKSRERKAS